MPSPKLKRLFTINIGSNQLTKVTGGLSYEALIVNHFIRNLDFDKTLILNLL